MTRLIGDEVYEALALIFELMGWTWTDTAGVPTERDIRKKLMSLVSDIEPAVTRRIESGRLAIIPERDMETGVIRSLGVYVNVGEL